MRFLSLRRAAGAALLAWCLHAAAAEPALRVGLEAGMPPFSENGTGFAVDLFRAVAARMHRDAAFVEAPDRTLLADLQSGKLDVLAGPVAATPERAAALLFTEGYVATEFAFAAPRDALLHGQADLRGRRLAVVDGSTYAEWADAHAARDGFRITKYADLAAALDAVRGHAADAVLAGRPELAAAEALGIGFTLPETRTVGAAAVTRNAVELRAEIEDALQCLKRDGTVARLAARFLHTTPDEDDPERLVIPGYGVPGLAGYDPKPSPTRC